MPRQNVAEPARPAPATQPRLRPRPATRPAVDPQASDAKPVLELWNEGITIAGARPFLIFAAWPDGTVVRRVTRDGQPSGSRQDPLKIGQVRPNRIVRLMRQVRQAGFFEPPQKRGIIHPDGPALYIRGAWEGESMELVHNGQIDPERLRPEQRRTHEGFVKMWKQVREAIDGVMPARMEEHTDRAAHRLPQR